MARSDDQANIRLPAELKEALRMQAQQNARSLNAEIVYRLRSSVGAELLNKREVPPPS